MTWKEFEKETVDKMNERESVDKNERYYNYMIRRMREEEEATIRRLASSDTPNKSSEADAITQILERIEKKIDKLIEKRG